VPFHRGYISIVGPERPTIEIDTATCCHCNTVFTLEPRQTPPWCRSCMKPVCERCHAIGTCRPLERWLERVEAKERTRRNLQSFGL